MNWVFSISIVTDVCKLDTGRHTMNGKKTFYNFQCQKKKCGQSHNSCFLDVRDKLNLWGEKKKHQENENI